MNRPHCQQTSACQAKGSGHCRSCSLKAVAKRLHSDPEFKAAHAERSREHMKRMNADPEFKAGRSEHMKRLHSDPEFKAAHTERMKRLHSDPEFKAGRSAYMKEMWTLAKAAKEAQHD